jgi:tetratricopeptide (TPR) repeat protein
MTVQDILQKLDTLFQQNETAQVEPFLLEHLQLAEASGDKPCTLTLLNELMGFYRGMSRFRDALDTGSKALTLMEDLGYKGSVPYATTLLNVATAYRAAGQTAKAISMFEEVFALFEANRLEDAYLRASLYNNLSLAYQEAGQHEKAIAYLNRALPLVQGLNHSDVEVAVTRTNLALSKLKCGQLADAKNDLLTAVSLFECQEHVNPHYGSALAGLGEVAYREGRAQDAVSLYERALEIIHAHYGKNLYYAVTLESLAVVCENIDKARSLALAEEAQQIQTGLR